MNVSLCSDEGQGIALGEFWKTGSRQGAGIEIEGIVENARFGCKVVCGFLRDFSDINEVRPGLVFDAADCCACMQNRGGLGWFRQTFSGQVLCARECDDSLVSNLYCRFFEQ